MVSWYQILLFVHVLFVFLYMLCHGASVAVAHRIRRERDVERIRALLDLSWSTVAVGYQLLMVAVLAGVGLGFMGHWWHAAWIWTSLAILIVVIVVMTWVAAMYFHRIRWAVGLAPRELTPDRPNGEALPQEAVTQIVLAGHPRVITAIGVIGLAMILWMMLFKPG